MKTHLVTLILAIASLKTGAQQYGPYRLRSANRLLARATPSCLSSRFGTELPLGLEYMFLKDASVLLEAGLPLNKLFDKRPRKEFRYDYYLRAELRAYFGYRSNSKWFAGLEGYMRQQAYREYNGGYMTNNAYPEDYLYRQADVVKQLYGGGIKVGYTLRLFGKLFAEASVGLGLKNVALVRSGIEGLTGPQKATRFMIAENAENNVPDTLTLFYFPAGISCSWLLGKSVN